MSEPEQNQPINPEEKQRAAGAAPVPSSLPTDDAQTEKPSAQPEFGRYSQPEYGAMSNQYPSNYNPYVYGAPEPAKPASEARQEAPLPSGGRNAWNGQSANPYSVPSQQQTGQPGNQYPYGSNPYGQNPYQQPGMYPIDLDDPQQNPMYGHWDSYAIISLVFAILLPVPVIPAVMGAVAMWRTKKLHMKGYALGVAALIINVLYTLAVLWMTVHGISTSDLYSQMMQYMFDGGSGSGGGSNSINA